MRSGGRTRIIGAVAGAVALHAGLALWLGRERPRKELPKRFTFELVEKKQPPPEPVPPREEVQEKKRPWVKLVVRQQRAPVLPSAPVLQPPVIPTPAPAAPAAKSEPSPKAGDELKHVKLFDSAALGQRLGQSPFAPGHDTGFTVNDGSGNSPAEERARVTERIEHDVTERHASDRVEHGLVDPYFRELAKSTNTAWK